MLKNLYYNDVVWKKMGWMNQISIKLNVQLLIIKDCQSGPVINVMKEFVIFVTRHIYELNWQKIILCLSYNEIWYKCSVCNKYFIYSWRKETTWMLNLWQKLWILKVCWINVVFVTNILGNKWFPITFLIEETSL